MNMTKGLLRHRTVTTIGATFAALTLLTACSSGGSSNPESEADGGTTDGATGDTTPIVMTGPEAELLGKWEVCNDEGGLRFDYEFTATTYINRVGTGTCAGFESPDSANVYTGPYTITGTTMSDSGLTAYTMELTTETINGGSVFASLIETRYRLVYTGTPDQLAFSTDTLDGEERSLTLNLNRPYVKFR